MLPDADDSEQRDEPFADVPDSWSLSATQLRWLSCETLLLCMPVDLSQLSEREAKALSHTIANQLGPEHTPAAILSTLRLEGHEHELMEHLQPYLHYRLLLLIYKRPGAFPSPTAFQDWAERQLSVVYNGVVGVLRSFAAPAGGLAEGGARRRVTRRASCG